MDLYSKVAIYFAEEDERFWCDYSEILTYLLTYSMEQSPS